MSETNLLTEHARKKMFVVNMISS